MFFQTIPHPALHWSISIVSVLQTFTLSCSFTFLFYDWLISSSSPCVTSRRGLPQRSRRTNLAGWFVKKNLPWESVLKFRQCPWQLLVDVRRGARTFDDPCILVSFMQLSLTLACIKALSRTPPDIHGSSHVPAPRLAAYEQLPKALKELWYLHHGIYFYKSSG